MVSADWSGVANTSTHLSGNLRTLWHTCSLWPRQELYHIDSYPIKRSTHRYWDKWRLHASSWLPRCTYETCFTPLTYVSSHP